jgi:hypothetical protein
MNWDALGAVAELAGAIGVIASLFYVASQIRRNSHALEAATNQAISDATQQRLLAPVQNSEFAETFAKAETDTHGLSPGERVQLDFFSRATFRGIQNAYFQHRKGIISDDAWKDYEVVVQNLRRRAHVRDWWSTERDTYDEAFVEHIEGLALRSPAA